MYEMSYVAARRFYLQASEAVAGPLLAVDSSGSADRIRLPFYARPEVLTEAVDRLATAWAGRS